MNQENWFASCPRGIENLLREELLSLGASEARETVAGVHFKGPIATCYRACLWSRLANRIMMPLAEFEPAQGKMLDQLREVTWEETLPPGATFVVDFTGQNRDIRNTQYGAQLTRDAIVDRFRDAGLPRPSVERKNPDIRFQVRLRRNRVNVALDLVGGSLHQRGFRQQVGAAPLKENLAAALLLRADWPGVAARGGALIDPMCGSGTLPLEAAMMAADIAPGLQRRHWAFERLPAHNRQQWDAILSDARSRAERGRSSELPEIRGYDADPTVIDRARENVEAAGLDRQVRFTCKPLSGLKKPTHRELSDGLVICNPPYGERLGDRKALPALYGQLGEVLMREFSGWQAAVFTADKNLGRATGIRSHRQYTLFNGALSPVVQA